jgi:hypothetical protein
MRMFLKLLFKMVVRDYAPGKFRWTLSSPRPRPSRILMRARCASTQEGAHCWRYVIPSIPGVERQQRHDGNAKPRIGFRARRQDDEIDNHADEAVCGPALAVACGSPQTKADTCVEHGQIPGGVDQGDRRTCPDYE